MCFAVTSFLSRQHKRNPRPKGRGFSFGGNRCWDSKGSGSEWAAGGSPEPRPGPLRRAGESLLLRQMQTSLTARWGMFCIWKNPRGIRTRGRLARLRGSLATRGGLLQVAIADCSPLWLQMRPRRICLTRRAAAEVESLLLRHKRTAILIELPSFSFCAMIKAWIKLAVFRVGG